MTRRSHYLVSLLGPVLVVLVLAAVLSTAETMASPGPLYVSTDPTCASHNPCYTSVQEALNNAASEDTIRVAAGTYTDPAGTVAEIVETVSLEGGWNASFTERNPELYHTVLDA